MKMASNALRFLDLADATGEPLVALDPLCVLDKERSVRQYVAYMLDRSNQMFEYEGLPDTIPAYMLELYLQIFGYAAFIKVDNTNPIWYPSQLDTPDGLYIFYGGIGGERDIYYRPRLFTAANPRLKNSIKATILYEQPMEVETPCVLMKNDRNYCGLVPLYNRYAAQLTENDISIRSAQINARAQIGISVNCDRDAETARKYLDGLEAGKLAVMGETSFLNGISVANVSTQSSNHIIQLIELQQYLKASWYNELGLNVNFNMKREYMSEEEIAVNTDILLPLVDDMLKCREEACELINQVFGTNIKVRKSSAWANKEQEELAALSTASMEGQIPLKETIQDRIEGGEVDAAEPEEEAVSAAVPSGGADEVSPEEVAGEGDGEAEQGNVDEVAPGVTVEVNVNINPEGGDADESETPEKSEESDSDERVS